MKNKYKTSSIEETIINPITTSGKKHIALVGGGMSAEREVSLMSSKAVLEALVELGYQVTFVDMGKDIAVKLAALKPDIVYNSLHGTYGEDGCLPGLLNIMQIPYTHSGVLASSLAFCKKKSKDFFAYNNIQTAPYFLVHKNDNLASIDQYNTYVIKPLNQGSSIGIEIIFPEDNYDFLEYDFPYGNLIMIEEYIKGREMQVAVLNGKALGVLEIELVNKKFYDYEAKYNEGFTKHIYPAPIKDSIYKKLLSESERAYKLLGCNGMARVEFIYDDKNEEIYILEINTHSGMTKLSICPEIAAHEGISFNKLIEKIIQTAYFEL